MHEDGSRTNTNGIGMMHKCWDIEAVYQRYKSMLVPVKYLKAGELLE